MTNPSHFFLDNSSENRSDNRSKIIGHDKSKHFNSENSRESVWFSEKFEKSRTSSEKKISKFLGNLPSERIFYRNVPLGAPENYGKKTKLVNRKCNF